MNTHRIEVRRVREGSVRMGRTIYWHPSFASLEGSEVVICAATFGEKVARIMRADGTKLCIVKPAVSSGGHS